MSDVIKIPATKVTILSEPTPEEREANRLDAMTQKLAWAFAMPRSAHHEAGHAICQHLSGVTVTRLNIKQDKDAQRWGAIWSRGYEVEPGAELMFLHAGEVAEQLLLEEQKRSSGDWRSANDVAEAAWPDDPERQAKEHERARANARQVLQEHWPAIKAVAGALMENEELSGDQVHWLLRKHGVPFAGGVSLEEESTDDEFDGEGRDETGGFSEGRSQEAD